MEDFGSLWSYQESVDYLKQKLLYTTLELETLKMEANEALKKHKAEHNNLLNLLKLAYQARGAAKDQLQNLLNKHIPNIPRHVLRESPCVVSTKANSSTTESNSLSETYNPQSHISSPVDSFFDSVSSPEFSNINIAAVDGSMSTGLVSPAAAVSVIETIAKEKALPQQGKLLQAVMEAGPLLQTLLVAGPLPHWRNPPPLQAFNMPPFCIYPKPAANSSCVAQKSLNSSTYLQKSRMSSQMCSTSMLNFSCCPDGSCKSNGILFTSGAGISNQIPSGKRQRFQ